MCDDKNEVDRQWSGKKRKKKKENQYLGWWDEEATNEVGEDGTILDVTIGRNSSIQINVDWSKETNDDEWLEKENEDEGEFGKPMMTTVEMMRIRGLTRKTEGWTLGVGLLRWIRFIEVSGGGFLSFIV